MLLLFISLNLSQLIPETRKLIFDVRGSVHHNIIHIKNPTRCNSVSKFISYFYEAPHVSGDTPPIIRSLKQHWQPLVFHTWKVVGRVVGGRCQAQCTWQRPPTTRPTTFHVWKTRGRQCSFRLLMMGGVSPETCWTSYKYGIIKFLIHCCFLLDFYMRKVDCKILCYGLLPMRLLIISLLFISYWPVCRMMLFITY